MSDARDIAMLIDAVAATAEDPMERFVKSLSDGAPHYMQTFARETLRMRDQFIEHAQRMLTATSQAEIAAEASWVQAHAHEIGYRWGMLRASCNKWLAVHNEPLVLRIGADRG